MSDLSGSSPHTTGVPPERALVLYGQSAPPAGTWRLDAGVIDGQVREMGLDPKPVIVPGNDPTTPTLGTSTSHDSRVVAPGFTADAREAAQNAAEIWAMAASRRRSAVLWLAHLAHRAAVASYQTTAQYYQTFTTDGPGVLGRRMADDARTTSRALATRAYTATNDFLDPFDLHLASPDEFRANWAEITGDMQRSPAAQWAGHLALTKSLMVRARQASTYVRSAAQAISAGWHDGDRNRGTR